MVCVEEAQLSGLLHQQAKWQWLLLPTIALHFLVGLCLFRSLEGPHSLEKSSGIFRRSSKPAPETRPAEDLGLATMENGFYLTPLETEKATKVEQAKAAQAQAQAGQMVESAACGKDTDCTGDSICVSNTCVAGYRADPRGQ
jgi:hypothetical protein